MRVILTLILFASVSWSAFWIWAGQNYKADLNALILNSQSAGWKMDVDDTNLYGYPNRFDITLKNPRIRSEKLNFGWRGDFLQILRLSYKKDHFIIVFPKIHQVKIGDSWFDVTSESLSASVVIAKDSNPRIVLDANTVKLYNGVLDLTFDKVQMAFLQIRPHFKLWLTLNNTKAKSLKKWKSLTVSADLISDLQEQKYGVPIFDLSSLVLENTTILINGTRVFEKRHPTKFYDLLLEVQVFLVGYDILAY